MPGADKSSAGNFVVLRVKRVSHSEAVLFTARLLNKKQ
jgi:hypothetical protein